MTVRSFLEKAGWAFIPALVLAFCYWFAGWMTSDMAELSYNIEKRTVNGLTSVYVEIFNNEDGIAIDELKLKSLPLTKLNSSISEGTKKDINVNDWTGTLASGNVFELLLISDKDIVTDNTFIHNSFSGRYQVRDENSGKLEWRNVAVSEQGIVAFNKSTAFMVWYFLPIILIIVIVVIVLTYMNRNSQSPQP